MKRIILLLILVVVSSAPAAETQEEKLKKHIDTLKAASDIGREMTIKVRKMGQELACMGDKPVKPLIELLLNSHSRDTRWAAAVILAMIGPEAKAAIPALEKTFNNKEEQIGIRVRAARAIASIKGTNPHEMYKAIPDLHKKLVEDTRAMNKRAQDQKLWENYLAGKLDKSWFPYRVNTEDKERAKAWYNLAAGKNLKEANQWLRDATKNGKDYGGRFVVWSFGKGARPHGDRLEPDVEKALKEKLFLWCDSPAGRDWGKPKPSALLKRILSYRESHVLYIHNWLTRSDAENYINLQCLANDPDFRERKFRIPQGKNPLHRDEPLAQGGDTVRERYELYNELWRRGLKEWSLHGLFNELASPHYEQKTYWGLFWVLDYVTDPVVKKRMKMFTDLAVVDMMQSSLSGVRGGLKSRAKSGGLTSRMDKDMPKWVGEYDLRLMDLPGHDIYVAPEPAILLRRLGPTVETYEIVNRLGQEAGEGNSQKLLSRSISYIYRTPDYTIGCGMFDPNKQYGPLGLWSGIIFRDKKAVYLDAYTGEKWNVQKKNVMITQCATGKYYGGNPRVDFTPGWKMAEKDGWVFVSNDEAYVAVKVARGGFKWKKPEQRRHLLPNEKYSPIIIQTGRKVQYGSFEKFQAAILNAPCELTDKKLLYHGPNSAKIEFFLSTKPYILPKIDGKTLDLDLKYNYKSPYMECRTGTDVVSVRYGDRTWQYDFGKNKVREIR